MHLLPLILLLPTVINAASMPLGTIVFFNALSCPTDFTAVTDHRGRVFIGAPTGAITTRVNVPAVSAFTDAHENTHTHTDSFTAPSLAPALSSDVETGTCFSGIFPLRGGLSVSSSGNAPSPSSSSGYPFTQLLACKLTATPSTYQVPQNAVAYMDPDASPGAVTACGTDWQAYIAGQGYIIVPADPTLVGSWAPSSYIKTSPTSAIPTTTPDISHSHPVTFPTPSITTSLTPSGSGGSSGGGVNVASNAPGVHAVSGSFASNSPQIPFSRALVYQSTNGMSGGTSVPSGGLLFFASGTCPTGWTASSTYKGRVIVNLPSGAVSSGTTFGSSNLLTLATQGRKRRILTRL